MRGERLTDSGQRRSTRARCCIVIAAAVVAIVITVTGRAEQSNRAADTQRETPAAARAGSDTVAIVGGMLIDGHEGDPVHDSAVLIERGKITAVGPRHSVKIPAGVRVVDATGFTVMPGLIDVHVHLDFLGHADYVAFHKKYSAIGPRADEINATSARQLLMAGVTSAVDLGGAPAFQVRNRDRINRGELVGPRMKVSAGWIWQTTPEAEKRHHRGMEGYLYNVHTAEEARTAIAKTLDSGADIIKLYTGLTADQVKTITEEAHKRGIKVTGHTSGDADLIMRTTNGQDAIEHMGFDANNPEVIRQLVARRTTVVPTPITQFSGVWAAKWPELLDNPAARTATPPDIWSEVRASLDHPERLPYFGRTASSRRTSDDLQKIKKLYDAGVRLLVGTDSGTPANFHTISTVRQMELLVEAGIPNAEVVGMATRLGAEYIGMGATLGTIEPGRLGDVIVVDGNPLISMRDLRHVTHVFKEGIQYKGLATPTKATGTSSQP